MAGLASFGRLTAAGWRLLRADALIPREADEALPPGLQTAGRILRVFAGTSQG